MARRTEVDVRGEGRVPRVDLEDGGAVVGVGEADVDLGLEAAGPEERAVDGVGPVRRAEREDAVLGAAGGAVEAVEEGREDAGLGAARGAGVGAVADERVDLVEEEDAGRGGVGGGEGGADRRLGLAEVGAVDVRAAEGDEGGARLGRAGLGQERL